jgi:hypothetical protein
VNPLFPWLPLTFSAVFNLLWLILGYSLIFRPWANAGGITQVCGAVVVTMTLLRIRGNR